MPIIFSGPRLRSRFWTTSPTLSNTVSVDKWMKLRENSGWSSGHWPSPFKCHSNTLRAPFEGVDFAPTKSAHWICGLVIFCQPSFSLPSARVQNCTTVGLLQSSTDSATANWRSQYLEEERSKLWQRGSFWSLPLPLSLPPHTPQHRNHWLEF